MTLQQLRYIIKVAEVGNITEAAKELYISQPSLTNAIKSLEDEMNITIFTRTNKGVTLTNDGNIFLSYARGIMDQTELLEERFLNKKHSKPHFSISCQHYSFAVNAFVDFVKGFDSSQYDFTIRETQTYEIINDVATHVSEIGVLYLSDDNSDIISKIIKQNDLKFTELITAKPHIFISSHHPLVKKDMIELEDLEPYPYLSFEQGQYNSFYFSEELLSTLDHKKNIKVRDRGTLFNLCIGLNGYTISSGIISENFEEHIVSRPLHVDEYMRIGYITLKSQPLSSYGKTYLEALRNHIVND